MRHLLHSHPAASNQLNCGRRYTRVDLRPSHDRFHDFREPRRGMRRHYDILYKDV